MILADDILVILGAVVLSIGSASAGEMRGRTTGGSARVPELLKQTHAHENTLRITLSRLKKQGLVQNDRGLWNITRAGLRHIREKLRGAGAHRRVPHHSYDPQLAKRAKSVIIVFDIPELHRKKRNWLRAELILLGFFPLQKSVWLGPAPLPREFINALAALDLLSYLKFFAAREKEIV